ncbi:MAG: aminotransferase class V-fold PLP-dependent enzyme [Clostridia bacterium]|nr:aminotransferase class V-fold PLP-dependent enzyme [Clostridia bacterium]
MIYLDNAATSRFKPKTVLDALNFDILHSANSGRAGHTDAVEKSIAIERCRTLILEKLGGGEDYNVIFTKNCTEALNLAILGSIQGGESVVTSKNEHNSVLRPLYRLEQQGKIHLTVLSQNESHKLNIRDIKETAKDADMFVFGGACNVTGATLDLQEVGKIARDNGVKFVVDGAQCVPYCDINLKDSNIDMLACPGHKGLHGIQGTGFLVVKKDIKLSPLLYGGTGTRSAELLPSIEIPESFEAGTMFSGGINALENGIKWTYDKLDFVKKHIDRLAKILIYNLHSIGVTVYTSETVCGVVACNVLGLDSTFVADYLNENDVAVRAGLHCAPLVHEHLGTLSQGAVRLSIGVDNTDKDILIVSSLLENLARQTSTMTQRLS